LNFDGAHRLIKAGDLLSLRHELERGADPSLSNRFGWTLLLAALSGNTTIGELLISRGADLDRKNKFGETALSLAAHGGHVPFVKLLLVDGATKECSPHGHSLEDWIKNTSGLPKPKIISILKLIAGKV
jgi:ankyrin repeat protein